MNVLVRKCRSALSLLSDRQQFRRALRRNVALLRCRASRDGSFRYPFQPTLDFVCVASNETSLRLFSAGYQEELEINVARSWLASGDFAVDVGANIGLISAVFAASVGASGTVLSLEPSPATFAMLVRTMDRLGHRQVRALGCCAADSSGVTSFFVSQSTEADAEEESMLVADARSGQFRRTITPKATLDDLCASLEPDRPPSVVKIDVEGAEPLVLQGSARMLERSTLPLMIVEVHRLALANFSFQPEDVLRWLPPEKFDRFFVPRSVTDATECRRHGVPYVLRDSNELPVYSNVIAVPRAGDFESRRAAVLNVLESHAAR